MFKIMWKSTWERERKNVRNEGYYDALNLIRTTLENKDGKIYLEPLTLVGDSQTIKDCLFLDCHPQGILVEQSDS